MRKSLAWKLLSLLPEPIRFELIRSQVRLEYDLPEGLHFKIADSKDEILQALAIIHDGFVERNLMDPNSSKMRINKFYCLPTTTIVVGKINDEVVATMSLIKDSFFGLPTDEYRDLSFLRRQGMKLVEASGLAIKKSYRSQKGRLMFPLTKYMLKYARDFAKADAFVISTVYEMRDLYRAVLLYRPLDGDRPVNYNTVKGAKAVSQWIPTMCQDDFKKYYGHKSKEKNLYYYLIEHHFPEFHFPSRPYYQAFDSVLTPEMMEEFFIEKSNVYNSLSTEEKVELRQTWLFDEYKEVIGSIDPNFYTKKLDRRHARIPVACPSTVLLAGEIGQIMKTQIDEISRSGIRMIAPSNTFKAGDLLSINIDLGPEKSTKLQARVVWTQREGFLGLEVTQATSAWYECIDYLEGQFRKSRKVGQEAA